MVSDRSKRIAAISEELASLLAEERAATLFALSEDDWSADDSPAADTARDICHKLLEATNADGLSGCRLCRS